MTLNVGKSKAAAAPPAKVLNKESANAIADLQKKLGPGVLMRGSEVPAIERLSTGIFEVDLALNGGIPKARMVIFYGPEGGGKSNLAACVSAVCQQTQPEDCNTVVWVDLEGTMDSSWMSKLGVDTEKLVVFKPGYGEQAVDGIDLLIRQKDVALIVIDSLAVLSSAKEVGGNSDVNSGEGQSAEKFDVGTAALLVKRLCNKLCWAFAAENTRGHRPTVLFINQTRFKIGVTMGDPETIPGGQAVKFNSSLTLRISSSGKIEKALHPTLPVFRETNVTVKKSKVPIRQQKFTYDMCVTPIDKNGAQLQVGQSDSWNIVKQRLQSDGHLSNDNKGWTLFGQQHKTLEPFRVRYYNDSVYRLKCQQKVLDGVKDVIMTVEAEGAAQTKGDVQKESWLTKSTPGGF